MSKAASSTAEPETSPPQRERRKRGGKREKRRGAALIGALSRGEIEPEELQPSASLHSYIITIDDGEDFRVPAPAHSRHEPSAEDRERQSERQRAFNLAAAVKREASDTKLPGAKRSKNEGKGTDWNDRDSWRSRAAGWEEYEQRPARAHQHPGKVSARAHKHPAKQSRVEFSSDESIISDLLAVDLHNVLDGGRSSGPTDAVAESWTALLSADFIPFILPYIGRRGPLSSQRRADAEEFKKALVRKLGLDVEQPGAPSRTAVFLKIVDHKVGVGGKVDFGSGLLCHFLIDDSIDICTEAESVGVLAYQVLGKSQKRGRSNSCPSSSFESAAAKIFKDAESHELERKSDATWAARTVF